MVHLVGLIDQTHIAIMAVLQRFPNYTVPAVYRHGATVINAHDLKGKFGK